MTLPIGGSSQTSENGELAQKGHTGIASKLRPARHMIGAPYIKTRNSPFTFFRPGP